MDTFFRSRRLYMLFVLPFLVMAIAFLGGYFPRVLPGGQEEGILPLSCISRLDSCWLSVIEMCLLLGVAYLIFFLCVRFKLLGQMSTLPSLIYVLLTSGIITHISGENLLVAVLAMAVASGRLLTAINDTKSNGALYDFGFLITLAVVIYPKSILLLAWALGVLFFSGRSTLKDIVALLLGILTTLLFVVVYYFWTDRLQMLPAIFTDNLMQGKYVHHLPEMELVRLGMIGLVLAITLIKVSSRYSLMVVSQRRGILSLISMMIFLVLTFVVIPGNYYDFMYMLAFPLSVLYAQYFISGRITLLTKLLFVLLLSACLLGCLV